MRKKLLLLLVPLSLCAFATFVKASELDDKQNQIDELEKKVSSLQSQAKTLKDQIAYYDGQIALTALKISQTEELVTSISGKINLLEGKLRERSVLLERQIVQTYKESGTDPLFVLFSSNDFSKALARFKYLQILQTQNRRFLHDTQLTQSNYAAQKTLLQESQKKLDAQKKSLASIRVERDNLLQKTQNDEAVYQKQLEQARLELQAIESALAAATKEGPGKAGDPIALMGNSGYPSCSTGAHLHFEVRVNDSWVNAETYLKNMTDKWGLIIGSGSWDWPMRGTIEITQRYGKTPYSYVYLYSGGNHTGVDMVSDDKVIHAVADGTLYSYTGKCGSSVLKLKYIDHGSGLKTLYLHVQ